MPVSNSDLPRAQIFSGPAAGSLKMFKECSRPPRILGARRKSCLPHYRSQNGFRRISRGPACACLRNRDDTECRLRWTGRAAEPNFPPIVEFAPRTSTKRYVRAPTHRALKIHGVLQLPHLAGAVDDELVDPAFDALPCPAEQAHFRRKP